MSDIPETTRVPKMPPEQAEEIARGLKWLADSYERAGYARAANNAARDSQWWLTYAISLAQPKASS